MRFPALLGLVAIACATQLPAQAPLFRPAPGSPVEVGSGSGQVLLADVNGDGHTDLITRHQQQEHVAIRLGDGTGRYLEAPGSPIALGYGPGDMELGDVNNDRILDLVVTHTGRDTVDVFLGDGRGGFRRVPGSPFAPSTAVDKYNKRFLYLVDLNGDGNLDIVTVNTRGTGFPTLLGDGRGGFRRGPVTAFEPGQTWNAVAFGDVDGDGTGGRGHRERPDGDRPGRATSSSGEETGPERSLAHRPPACPFPRGLGSSPSATSTPMGAWT